ncbi:hypothetical protein I4U30_22955 [Enterobacter asburiae]|uniref:hypothetical protein n=1 Tax=Enterobacter asburiae TaxID=61645 RepID=UPI00192BFB70|nr:hypothetical protein [Enterobacter asburiae]MBL5841126.1 hypothetical protein [Enterobacter asburiae]
MTTVFHTTGVLDHAKKRFDIPDIEIDLKKIYEDTEHQLSYLEFSSDPDDESDFDKQKGKVESELEELKTYAKGSELADYQTYVADLERQVEALTWGLLNVARRADNMAHNILSVDNKMDRAEIADEFNYIVGDATNELGCDFVLRRCLQERGWNEWQRDYLDSIVPTSTIIELLVHASTPSDMIIGVDSWIAVAGDRVTLMNGKDRLHLTKEYGEIAIHAVIDGVTSSLKTGDIKHLFMDILHPTDEEIQMYEMAHHKSYDISMWRDIFGTKPK